MSRIVATDPVQAELRGLAQLKRHVLEPDLCCGCGACVGVCRSGALRIEPDRSHRPIPHDARCRGCGLCYEVCPGRGYAVFAEAAEDRGAQIPWNPERGPVCGEWIGHSTDPQIRAASASGGVATSLLVYLLESKQVDDVAVVGMENERPVVRLTHDPEVVMAAMMSKYGPVPSMATLIPELRRHPRRVAMTVTPCQLGAWRRAAKRIPALRDCLTLSIGLFCGQVQSFEALSSIAAALGLQYPGEARFVGWRCGPYPGSARFERPDGSVVEMPLYRWQDVAIPHFSLHRCALCPDGANWRADMTLGDIHAGGTDETVIVCRTRRGEAVLEAARQAGRIECAAMTSAQAEASVIRAITRSKLFPALAVNEWLHRRGRPAPQFDYPPLETMAGRASRLRHAWVVKYRLTKWARRGWQRRFLLRHPRLMERVGHFLYYFPATLPGYSLLLKARGLARTAMAWRRR